MQQTPNIQAQIVRKAIKGDPQCRAELYHAYSKAMYNICIRMMGNEPDAADIFQEAFTQAFSRIAQLKQPEAFGGWLKQIVIRQCIRACSKTIQWRTLTETDILHDDDDEWWTGISLEAIHHEIRLLPDGCRQVFVLFAVENLSHKEVATQLEISESTSKSQYQRARRLLKSRLLKLIEQHG